MKRLWDWLLRRKRVASAAPGMAGMLANTADVEIGCDEVYELLDQYADALAAGRDPQELLPLVHHHLSMCKDCHEELEALLKAIEQNGRVRLGLTRPPRQ